MRWFGFGSVEEEASDASALSAKGPGQGQAAGAASAAGKVSTFGGQPPLNKATGPAKSQKVQRLSPLRGSGYLNVQMIFTYITSIHYNNHKYPVFSVCNRAFAASHLVPVKQ